MMVAQTEQGERREAWQTPKSHAPFFCPECCGEVILKKGRVREHHFAHKPPVTCLYGTGESQIHLKMKREICEALRGEPNCERCELERRLDGVRPDISLRINGYPVAIEVQRSNIPVEEIDRRMIRYSELGIYVAWVFPPPSPDQPFNPKVWQRFLHSMFFGRIYFWVSGALVQGVHLSPHYTWAETRTWFDEGGNENEAGGYWRKSKRARKPVPCWYPFHLSQDFKPTRRNGFETREFDIPACRLWIDEKTHPWWEESKPQGLPHL